MRLPYGDQKDEADAQAGLAVIQPDELVTVDIQPAADAMLQTAGGQPFVMKPTRISYTAISRPSAHDRSIRWQVRAPVWS